MVLAAAAALLAIGVLMVHAAQFGFADLEAGADRVRAASEARLSEPGRVGPGGSPSTRSEPSSLRSSDTASAGEPRAEGVSLFGMAAGVLASKTTVYAVLAIAAMLFASRINVRMLFENRGLGNPLFMIVLASLALVAMTFVPGMGRSVKGASRWLWIGPRSYGLSFQPSELVKWVLVIAIAWWCARRRGVMHRFGPGLLPPLVLCGVACGLIVLEDLGTAVLIAVVCGSMLLAGGARWWQLAALVPVGGAAVVAAIVTSPYRVARLTAFMDPWADAQGTGYHPIHAMLAFARGGWTGSGLGNSLQKHYLPEQTNDFILPVLAEELGFAGVATVVALFLVVLWVGLGIVRDCKDTFGRLVGLGVLMTIGLQAAMNLAVVTVVVPTKGIALPLISSGGTGWVLCAFSLGLLAALDNANYLHLAPTSDEQLVPAELDEDDVLAPEPDAEDVRPVLVSGAAGRYLSRKALKPQIHTDSHR